MPTRHKSPRPKVVAPARLPAELTEAEISGQDACDFADLWEVIACGGQHTVEWARNVHTHGFNCGGVQASTRANDFLQWLLDDMRRRIEQAEEKYMDSNEQEPPFNFDNGRLVGLREAALSIQKAFGCTGDQRIVMD